MSPCGSLQKSFLILFIPVLFCEIPDFTTGGHSGGHPQLGQDPAIQHHPDDNNRRQQQHIPIHLLFSSLLRESLEIRDWPFQTINQSIVLAACQKRLSSLETRAAGATARC
jgi:hypothetical protein